MTALFGVQTVAGVTLAWNPNSEPDIVAYRLYYGTTSGQYSHHVEIPGATSGTVNNLSATVNNLKAQQPYFFVVTAYNNANLESLASNEVSFTVPLPSPNPTPIPWPSPARGPAIFPLPGLVNGSTRARIDSGDRVMIGGFVLSGANPKNVLLRSLGPSLGSAGVAEALADPVVELYNSVGEIVAWNDDLSTSGQTLPEGMAPSRSDESAMVASLPPGSYTAIVHSSAANSGVALFELYDLDPAASRISKISTRGEVGTDDNVMIGGFTIGGVESTRVILRAIGPSLTAAGVAGALQDPVLELRNRNGSLLFQNDNWRDTQEARIISSSIPPTDDRESAIVATLPPGSYTTIVRGASDSTGIASIEVYNVEDD